MLLLVGPSFPLVPSCPHSLLQVHPPNFREPNQPLKVHHHTSPAQLQPLQLNLSLKRERDISGPDKLERKHAETRGQLGRGESQALPPQELNVGGEGRERVVPLTQKVEVRGGVGGPRGLLPGKVGTKGQPAQHLGGGKEQQLLGLFGQKWCHGQGENFVHNV